MLPILLPSGFISRACLNDEAKGNKVPIEITRKNTVN